MKNADKTNVGMFSTIRHIQTGKPSFTTILQHREWDGNCNEMDNF